MGNSLVVQWLGLRASTAGGPDSIPGRGTKILQVAWCGQKNKQTKNIYTLKIKKQKRPKEGCEALASWACNREATGQEEATNWILPA